ncbi:MAG: glycosyl transferase [Rhizobium sp. 63-7]|nr:MAG: glycosyl transferase [Rhizobium sp. 63-7]
MTVSIIVKTLNEETKIAMTIESALAALERVGGEVIVADSGSRDRTVEIASLYPVIIAQIEPPALPSCGLGPQLGYQYSRHPFLCLIDGDMLLDPDFLPAALTFMAENPEHAGVTGHVEEMEITNLEFARRVNRNARENRTGSVDRMNGGGVYRREAIEKVGYLSDRNLHGYEEFDLGARLRSAGWLLHRLDQRYVQHYGHTENSYRLLIRRWRSKYIFGLGEMLRASLGRPYFRTLFRELPELRLWVGIYVFWIFCLALLIALPNKLLGLSLVAGLLALVVGLMSQRKGGFSMGLYTVVAWFFNAAALPVGFLRPRREPSAPIESRLRKAALPASVDTVSYQRQA